VRRPLSAAGEQRKQETVDLPGRRSGATRDAHRLKDDTCVTPSVLDWAITEICLDSGLSSIV